MISRKVIPGSSSRLTIVDHNETYGRHLLENFIKDERVNECLDLGCGTGADLEIVKSYNSNANLYGVDFGLWNAEILREKGIKPIALNIEIEKLPFKDNSLDLIIANQIIEHTKEIFWINHEIFRCLKPGGTLILAMPNVLSLHNRILMLFGFHPTCNKSISAHVRVFSKRDVYEFYKTIGDKFTKIVKHSGSQFYPFPKVISRPLSAVFPNLAFTSFYVIKKTGKYTSEFIDWPGYAKLETNFYTGK